MKKINEMEEIDLVNRLGVSIGRDGSLYPFGDKHNKSHFHGERYMIEVIPYISSDVSIDKSWDDWETYKNVASQGVITICNLMSDEESVYFVLIYSPDTLTNNQIKMMNQYRQEFLDKCPNIEVSVIDSQGKVINGDDTRIGWTFEEYINRCLSPEDVQIKK